MSESRKRLSLGLKKTRKTPKKPVMESVSPDLMLDTLLEESEKKVAELKVVKELNAKKEDEAKAEPQEETEKPEEDEKEEKKPSRQRLSLGKKKRKLKKEEPKKEEVKEAKVEAPKEKLVTDRNMFNVPEDEKKAAAERLKAKTAAKRAAKKDLSEEVLETPQDRIMSALDGQLSAMGRLTAVDAPESKSLTEQKIDNLEGQVRDMRRMMLEMTSMPTQNTIVGGLGAGSPGSGEVNYPKLDDVKGESFEKDQDGQLVLWSEVDQKFISSAERGVDNFFSEGIGGYEFTGGFSDRESGSTGASDFGTFIPYTQAMADSAQWRRFGFSESQQQANDNAYFPTDARPGRVFDQSKGLFGGIFMPSGVTELIDYGWSDTVGGTLPNGDPFTGYSTEVNSGNPADFNYTAADGSFDFRECQPGDLLQLRFDFNVNVQIANTTLEIALIWQTRDANDNPTFTFALTGQPIFYGTGTVGRTFLNRPFLSAYFASAEDTNARALLAIRADNPIQVAPLSTLVTIQR